MSDRGSRFVIYADIYCKIYTEPVSDASQKRKATATLLRSVANRVTLKGPSMEEEVILGRDGAEEAVKRFLSQYDAPAYIRRARGVEAAWEQLLDHCRRRRAEWLGIVRLRIALLHGSAGDWDNLLPLLANEEQLDILRYHLAALASPLRAPIERTTSARAWRHALHELHDSLQRFNRRWQTFLESVDLIAINELREGYNRYYVLEKECAVRSTRVARQGFVPLQPLTLDDLTAQLPLLPVPRLRP